VSRRSGDRGHFGRRGVILPLALLVIAFLAVLAAQVVFRSSAELAAASATKAALQARLAAEAGIQKAILILRENRSDIDAWYDNSDAFRAQIVNSDESGSTGGLVESEPKQVSPENKPIWRFSVVADDATSDGLACRYGLTDEASKLNINVASKEQLATLISLVVTDRQVNVSELVDAIIDWRDSDDEPEPDGAESEYYQSLTKPYSAKNGPFDSVEELLLVKGFDGRILFGEDWNRNGILDPNENDGDESFPPDNNDGELSRGLYPFLTVWSWEPNTASDNRPRINLNARDLEKLAEQLAQYFSPEQVDAIIAARQQGKTFRTPIDLLTSLEDNADLEATFSEEDLPLILDVLTTLPMPMMPGLVNVNTAPAEVLRAVGFTPEETERIISTRATLSSEEKSSLAWLVEQGVLELDRLAEMYGRVTVRSFQFSVESVGFADHVGTFCRLQAVIEMRGPLAQILYWRDLTGLGLAWPVRLQEESTGVVASR